MVSATDRFLLPAHQRFLAVEVGQNREKSSEYISTVCFDV